MSTCPGECALRRAAAIRAGSTGAAASGPADPSRRSFVTHALLVSVGAFLSACGDWNIGGVTGPGGTSGTGGPSGTYPPPPVGGVTGLVVTLVDFPALATDGGIARVDGNTSVPIAVTRVNASTYLAFSMICPHAGYRPINIVGGSFECPNHGAQFAGDGTWTGGQRTSDLNRYTVTLNPGAGTLTIT